MSPRLVTLLLASLSGCQSQTGDQTPSRTTVTQELAVTKFAAIPVIVERFARTRNPVALGELALSDPVRKVAARDILLVGQSIKCWPSTRPRTVSATGRSATTNIDQQLGYAHIDTNEIKCSRREPSGLPNKDAIGSDHIIIPPGHQFAALLPIYPLIEGAGIAGRISLKLPPPTLTRRWHSALRIKPSGDPVTDAALRTLLANRQFTSALHGLSIRMTDERPNALIVGEKAALQCWQLRSNGVPCQNGAKPNRTGTDTGIVQRDRLVRKLTGDRFSYLDNGSDFATMAPIVAGSRERGFTIGTSSEILGAVCLLDDYRLSAEYRASSPRSYIAQPAYRQSMAVQCLLRILGLAGQTGGLLVRYGQPTFAGQSFTLVRTISSGQRQKVVVTQDAIAGIDRLYR